MVERALCMCEVRGSKPRISTFRSSLFPGELSFNFFFVAYLLFSFFFFSIFNPNEIGSLDEFKFDYDLRLQG